MAEAFHIRWKLDRPFLEQNRSEDIFTLLTIEPNPGVMGGNKVSLPVHIILLVDVSASMDYLVRFDPTAKVIGEGRTEGKVSERVFSNVPSRREMACTLVQNMVGRLQSQDILTLVAFDQDAHVLGKALSPDHIDQVHKAVQALSKVGGGGTRLGKGMESIRYFLTNLPDPNHTRKLVILTDGEDESPGLAMREGQLLARDFHVPIVAFGMGECKVAFLTEVAKTTLAGTFNHIRNETDADQLYNQVLMGQKNIQATNVVLRIWLSPDIFVRELFRTKPEVLYVGDLTPDDQHMVELRLEQMEGGKAYEFLFRATIPGRPAGQRFRLAKASLIYDLPALGKVGEKVETNIVVEFTTDPERARERSGDVFRVLSRAEVQRQVLFLQNRADALANNQGSDKDRVVVANLLNALIAKFEGFGDQAMVNQYKQMRDEFQSKGTISQDMLNRSLAASSRAEEIIVAKDLDF